jgi:mannosyltransferase PIG-V
MAEFHLGCLAARTLSIVGGSRASESLSETAAAQARVTDSMVSSGYGPASTVERPVERDLASSPRELALRDSWLALWTSRLLVWATGVAAVGVLGVGSAGDAFDPRGLTRGLGRVGEALAGPAARWDAAWYLTIAKSGYQPDLGTHTISRAAFFPAYPLAVRAVGFLQVPLILAGVLVSLCAFGAALYGIHRLTSLEFAHTARAGRPAEIARLSVFVMAFAPMAVFFSAVYTESFFLAFSVALFWSARQGRWMWVGVAGAIAVATRSNGLVLALPAAVIYLYGPREDRTPDRAPAYTPAVGAERARGYAHRALALLTPRYRVRRDALWLGLLPASIVVFAGSLALAGGDALAPFKSEHEVWKRQFVGPLVGLWDAVHHPHVTSFLFLLAAIPAIVGALRRLPLAYGLYALAAVAVDISYPADADPLTSLPRYLLVLFPLGMWFAAWLSERRRLQVPLLALSALAMMVFVARFSTWHWAS